MKKIFLLVALSATMYAFENREQVDQRIQELGKPQRVLRMLFTQVYRPSVYYNIEYLIHKGAPVDTHDDRGNTALRYALFNYCAFTRKESADHEGLMALDRAPHLIFIRELLDLGAQFDMETVFLFGQLQQQYHLSSQALERISKLYRRYRQQPSGYTLLHDLVTLHDKKWVKSIDTHGNVECELDDSNRRIEGPILHLHAHIPGKKTYKQHPRFADPKKDTDLPPCFKSADAFSCKLL